MHMHIIMPMHYVTKTEIEYFRPSGPPNIQNVVAPMHDSDSDAEENQ